MRPSLTRLTGCRKADPAEPDHPERGHLLQRPGARGSPGRPDQEACRVFPGRLLSKQRERHIAGEKPRRFRGTLSDEFPVTLSGKFFLASVGAFQPDTAPVSLSHRHPGLHSTGTGGEVRAAPRRGM